MTALVMVAAGVARVIAFSWLLSFLIPDVSIS